jgi:hypothetical protein
MRDIKKLSTTFELVFNQSKEKKMKKTIMKRMTQELLHTFQNDVCECPLAIKDFPL